MGDSPKGQDPDLNWGQFDCLTLQALNLGDSDQDNACWRILHELLPYRS